MSTATESDEELLASLEPGSFAVFYRRHDGEIARGQRTSEAVVRKRVSRGLAAVRQRMGPRA